MNTIEFLTAFWPLLGIYVIVTGPFPPKKLGGKPKYRHKHFTSIEAAAAFAVEQRDKTNVYFALHSFRDLSQRTSEDGRNYVTVERTQDNALCTVLFYLDLDVGESTAKVRKYATRDDALRALVAWVEATSLPRPSVIFSGTGVHVYWRLTADLDSREWQITADKLQHLCDHHKLLVDRTITTDSARILRPIHTKNHKDPANPVKVELKRLANPVSIEMWAGAVDAALAGLPELPRGRTRAVGQASRSGIILPESSSQPPTVKQLGAVCGTFRRMAAEAKTCNGAVWRNTLCLSRLEEEP